MVDQFTSAIRSDLSTDPPVGLLSHSLSLCIRHTGTTINVYYFFTFCLFYYHHLTSLVRTCYVNTENIRRRLVKPSYTPTRPRAQQCNKTARTVWRDIDAEVIIIQRGILQWRGFFGNSFSYPVEFADHLPVPRLQLKMANDKSFFFYSALAQNRTTAIVHYMRQKYLAN